MNIWRSLLYLILKFNYFLFFFLGVYLPLLWEPSFCNVSPVALGYTRGHFSALVPMESPQPEQSAKEESIQVCYLPLVDKDRKLLPIHFLTKAEVSNV